ncbi:LOW QUALITY PROTEIN: hypothetical protein Cgig2_012987 [Carnegiea gigantea]|uniref:Uncharacterized protein n=1 Tax=Carnegiea gigantea TaxID=171969 RepID=A0A9Q1QEW4_9CARY|nr:LOW QUALITY PROTEIN: hypothetical protein Cgig2_012987 [Carnegiea gigantea]
MLLDDAMKLGVPRGWMIGNYDGAPSRHGSGTVGAGSWRPIYRKHPMTRKYRRARGRGVSSGNTGIRHPITYYHVTRTEWCRNAGQFRNTWSPFAPPIPLYKSRAGILMEGHLKAFHWRSASRPSRLLPEDYQELCPHFTLSEVEEAARDFDLSEMVQATFYAMLLNDVVELGIARGFIATYLKASLEGCGGHPSNPGCISTSTAFWKHSSDSEFHRWRTRTSDQLRKELGERERENRSDRGKKRKKQNDPISQLHKYRVEEFARDTFRWSLRECSACRPNLLLEDHRDLCPSFDRGVAMQYAHNSNISKMVQMIFYAVVLNDAAKLRLGCKLTIDYIMWVIQKLDWAPIESWLRNIENRLRRA